MNIDKIHDAKAVALRFLDRVKDLDREAAALRNFTEFSTLPPRPAGAVRRASLDLTRALAEMRKP